jgi:hypothetical protein
MGNFLVGGSTKSSPNISLNPTCKVLEPYYNF